MSKCYRQMNGKSIGAYSGLNACTNFTSSNGYTPCCFTGSVCLENSLCYTPNAASGSTGYYEALCSDPTFKDPSCSKKCTAYTKGDAVFDPSSNLWSCCGADSNGNPNCGNPTNTTFTAPNPSALLLLATGTATLSSSSSTSSSTSTATSAGAKTTDGILASSTSTASSSATPGVSSSSGTSVGLIAGVVVGVVVVLLALAGLFFFLYARRRRQRRSGAQPIMPTTYYDKVPTSFNEKIAPRDAPHTPLPAYTHPAELSGDANTQGAPQQQGAKTTVYELGG